MKYQKISSPLVKRTSDLLQDIAQTTGRGEITIGDFVAMLGERSFALAILIFSLPNSLPIPGVPGFSTLTGLPILFIALQILCGRKDIWLPRKVAAKRFQGEFLTKIIRKALPVVIWLEKLLHPRLTIVCESIGERFIGFLIAMMAFILALPIAGANFLPALSISLLALALLENDGFFAALSILFTLASLCFMYEVILLVVGGTVHWVSGLM